MKKIVWLLWISLPVLSFSQRTFTIRGYVGDSLAMKPLPYASVIIKSLHSDSIYYGAITDTNGYFELKKINLKNDFEVRVSFIGFKTFSKQYFVTKARSRIFIVAKLKPNKNRLNTVVVKDKAPRKEDIDKTTITVDSSLLANAITTVDMLKKIPEIRVNPITNTATIKGKENTFVMVNGVMTNKSINLRSINPKTIEKIEIINIPSGEFDNSIDGVINIVLKDNSSSINSYSENEYLPHKAFNSYNGIAFNHKKHSLGIDYYFENKHYNIYSETHRNLTNENDEYLQRRSITPENNKDINNEIDLHYDYHISKHSLFSIYSSNYFYKTDKLFSTASNHLMDDTSGYYVLSHYKSRTNVINSSNTTYYKQQLNKKGLKLIVNNNFTINKSAYYLDYEDSIIVPDSQMVYRSYNDASGYISDNFIPKISIPINKSRLETGIAVFYKSFNDNYSTNTEAKKVNYQMLKTNYFADFEGTVKKMQYRLSLKYETYNYHVYGQQYTDYSIQPSIYLFKKINKNNSLRFSYSDHSSFPSIWKVCAQDQMDDSLNYYTGNRKIKPMYVHKVSLSYKFRKKEDLLNFSLNTKYYKDMIVSYYTVDANNVLTVKPINIDGKLKHYINISGSKTFFERLSFDYDVNLYRENFVNKNDNRVNYSWEGSFMLYFAAPYGFILGGMYDYTGKTLTYLGSLTQSPSASVFVGMRLFDDMARITLSYNFYNSQEIDVADQPAFHQIANNNIITQGWFFRFNFYFYKGKEVKLENYEKHIDLDTK